MSGGISKERLISLDTGLQVAKELKKNGYKVKISEPDKNLEINIKNFKPNVIFNALHGQFGEDGYIQSILDTFKIPYTHSGVIASSIAMDKEISKKIFLKNKIKTPKFIIYSYDISISKLIKESVPLEKSFGDASISQKHCNFFVNKGNAKFEDMIKLIDFVSDSVFKKTGIKLEKEIKILE